MEYIYVGDIINTHGIKGEVKVLSDFKYKEEIFKKEFTVFVGRFKDELKIDRYRKHQNYDLIIFDGINDINDVIIYKGDKMYVNKEDLKINGYINEDIIGLDVFVEDKKIGQVKHIISNNAHEILVIYNDEKKYLVPYIDEFINNIDLSKKRIDVNEIEGLIDEN